MREVSCPSCGAPVKFVSAAALLSVCGYCRATLMRRDLDVENLGKMAELIADPTPVQLGVEGRYRGTHFAVVGRLQVEYPDGAWNEWFLTFEDGRTGWLGEASGTYTVSFETQIKEPLPTWEDVLLLPGHKVTLNGRTFEVADARMARVVGGEGELPFNPIGWYEARVADLRSDTASFATLDYSEDPPRVFLGEVVEFDTLQLRGLREFEGW
jgi:hypothetical protein